MKQVKPQRRVEIIDELREIQDEMGDLVSRLSRLCDELGDSRARNYLIAPLEIAVEQGSWMHRDMTLPKWIEELQEEDIDWHCDEVVEKMQDEIKADYYFERGE